MNSGNTEIITLVGENSKNIPLTDGDASRYIKQDWIADDYEINSTAFDLRQIKPPETYISFFIIKNDISNGRSKMSAAYALISNKLKNIKNGAIILIDISECLEEINDEEKELIGFYDQNLPHCGLHYLTEDPAKLTEIKNTLCFLAKERLEKIVNIQHEICAQNIKALTGTPAMH